MKKYKTYSQRSGNMLGFPVEPGVNCGYITANSQADIDKIEGSEAFKNNHIIPLGAKEVVIEKSKFKHNNASNVQLHNPLQFSDNDVAELVKLNEVDPDAIQQIQDNIRAIIEDRLGTEKKKMAEKKAAVVTDKVKEIKKAVDEVADKIGTGGAGVKGGNKGKAAVKEDKSQKRNFKAAKETMKVVDAGEDAGEEEAAGDESGKETLPTAQEIRKLKSAAELKNMFVICGFGESYDPDAKFTDNKEKLVTYLYPPPPEK